MPSSNDPGRPPGVTMPSRDAPGATPAPVLDMSSLQQLDPVSVPAGTERFSVRIAKLYLKTSPDLIARLKTGASDGDTESVRFAAHTLKSGTAMLGAHDLARALASLETIARTPPIADATSLVESIASQYRQVCEALDAYIRDNEA